MRDIAKLLFKWARGESLVVADQQKKQSKLSDLIQEELRSVDEIIADLQLQIKPIAPDNAIGRLSRMEAINSKAVAESALALAQTKKIKLQSAQSRLSDPQFGFCEDCGKSIPFARLMLVPESTLCVGCIDYE